MSILGMYECSFEQIERMKHNICFFALIRKRTGWFVKKGKKMLNHKPSDAPSGPSPSLNPYLHSHTLTHSHTFLHFFASLNVDASSNQRWTSARVFDLTLPATLLLFVLSLIFWPDLLLRESLSCGRPVHTSSINNPVNNVKSIVFSKVVLINMNEFICLHQSVINAH